MLKGYEGTGYVRIERGMAHEPSGWQIERWRSPPPQEGIDCYRYSNPTREFPAFCVCTIYIHRKNRHSDGTLLLSAELRKIGGSIKVADEGEPGRFDLLDESDAEVLARLMLTMHDLAGWIDDAEITPDTVVFNLTGWPEAFPKTFDHTRPVSP